MEAVTPGIHHVTAISGEPQRNVEFYVGLLGLRLVKKTVNFDDPGTYHLYYGDGAGSPGSIMTFFPWDVAPKGRIGTGQLTVTSFSFPASSLGYWTEHLVESGIRFEKPEDRFGETVLRFPDPDGLRLELVAASDDRREGWSEGPLPPEHAVRGLHHVAFRVPDEETQLELREKVAALGYNVTHVLDRNYFRSIYFREPGGVLFEIATDPPGFTADEDPERLGESLKLPPWLEPRREQLEEVLPPLSVPAVSR